MDIFIFLTLVFVILKATSVISWSWWWVFSPMILEFILIIVNAILTVVITNKYKK